MKIARSEKMKLYNKIQELINESETLKQKNNEVLGLAKNELSELVNQKANENLENLKPPKQKSQISLVFGMNALVPLGTI